MQYRIFLPHLDAFIDRDFDEVPEARQAAHALLRRHVRFSIHPAIGGDYFAAVENGIAGSITGSW